MEEDVDVVDGDIRKGGGVCCGVEDFRGMARRNALLPPLILYILSLLGSNKLKMYWILWCFKDRRGGVAWLASAKK